MMEPTDDEIFALSLAHDEFEERVVIGLEDDLEPETEEHFSDDDYADSYYRSQGAGWDEYGPR